MAILVVAAAVLGFVAAALGASDLHFYMHDIVGTNNDTAIVVARPTDPRSTTAFGTLFVIDDKLTEGPSLDSREVGRAQGTYMGASMSSVSLFMSFTAVLDNGTVSFQGKDVVFDKVREISVIGGTGAFRFASGYALLTTHTLQGLYAIIDVNVFLNK